MEKTYAADELEQLFMTGRTDFAGNGSHFYCQICRKKDFLLTSGPHKIFRPFQRAVTIAAANVEASYTWLAAPIC